jgi:hypothetical protein
LIELFFDDVLLSFEGLFGGGGLFFSVIYTYPHITVRDNYFFVFNYCHYCKCDGGRKHLNVKRAVVSGGWGERAREIRVFGGGVI